MARSFIECANLELVFRARALNEANRSGAPKTKRALSQRSSLYSKCIMPSPHEHVLDFFFPERSQETLTLEEHRDHWLWRMRGGADEGILARFKEQTKRAARGELDAWARIPEGRLALIVLLDQFSRTVYRGSPRAFAQDPQALRLCLDGLERGDLEALEPPWFKIAYTLPLGHCEGADHLERVERLIGIREEIARGVAPHLRPAYDSLAEQARIVRGVIKAFGRHPHRNAILRRASTEEERRYLEKGRLPHERVLGDL